LSDVPSGGIIIGSLRAADAAITGMPPRPRRDPRVT